MDMNAPFASAPANGGPGNNQMGNAQMGNNQMAFSNGTPPAGEMTAPPAQGNGQETPKSTLW